MTAMALSGYLVSRFGNRRMPFSAASLYFGRLMALGCAMTTWQLCAMTTWQLCAMVLFFGISANLHNISVNTQAVGVERLYRRSIMASLHGSWSPAGFGGGLLGTLLAAFPSAPVRISVLAVTMAIVASLHRFTLPWDVTRAVSDAKGKTKGRLEPHMTLPWLIAFGCMAAGGAMYDWSAVYCEAVIKPSREVIRLGSISYRCATVCGRFMADGLGTRFGVFRILQIGGVLIASGLLKAALLPMASPRASALRRWAPARPRSCPSATACPG